MIEVQEKRPGGCRLVGEAILPYADGLHNELNALDLNDNESLEIDMAGLTLLDSTCAQILIAFRKSSSKGRVSYVNCPTALLKYLQASGLSLLLFQETIHG